MPSGESNRKKEGLRLNWTHQLPAYDNDFNIVGENIDTIQKKHRISARR
jgi:hypothetical protein